MQYSNTERASKLVNESRSEWHSYLQKNHSHIDFSALILLVCCQYGHSTCKHWVMRCWCGYLSGARCKWFAYGPADENAITSSHSS